MTEERLDFLLNELVLATKENSDTVFVKVYDEVKAEILDCVELDPWPSQAEVDR